MGGQKAPLKRRVIKVAVGQAVEDESPDCIDSVDKLLDNLAGIKQSDQSSNAVKHWARQALRLLGNVRAELESAPGLGSKLENAYLAGICVERTRLAAQEPNVQTGKKQRAKSREGGLASKSLKTKQEEDLVCNMMKEAVRLGVTPSKASEQVAGRIRERDEDRLPQGGMDLPPISAKTAHRIYRKYMKSIEERDNT